MDAVLLVQLEQARQLDAESTERCDWLAKLCCRHHDDLFVASIARLAAASHVLRVQIDGGRERVSEVGHDGAVPASWRRHVDDLSVDQFRSHIRCEQPHFAHAVIILDRESMSGQPVFRRAHVRASQVGFLAAVYARLRVEVKQLSAEVGRK